MAKTLIVFTLRGALMTKHKLFQAGGKKLNSGTNLASTLLLVVWGVPGNSILLPKKDFKFLKQGNYISFYL